MSNSPYQDAAIGPRLWNSGLVRCNLIRNESGDLTNASQARYALTIGEVHTGLLQNSTALAGDRVTALLDRVVGERVRSHERPIPYAVSPDQLTGVDCSLPSGARRGTRAVGTVVGHAAVTGGHVLQGSAYAEVDMVRGQRQAWSHYLARPGTLEAIGKMEPADVATGFLTGQRGAATLEIGAVSGRLMDEIQVSPHLDRERPFRSRRTVLRWAVLPAASGGNSAVYTIESKTVRTLLIRYDERRTADLVALCEDLSLHDWLLTTLVSLLDRITGTPDTRVERVKRLDPAVDCLLHLWMPAARVEADLLPLWQSLDHRSGFSRQWHTSVDRIRDQLTLSTMMLLEAARQAGRSQP
jgi:hypothetical protein